MKVLKELVKMCYAKLYSYPRTLQGDKMELQNQTISYNSKNAINAVLMEKQALMDLIEASEEVIDILMMRKKSAIIKIQDGDFENDIEKYAEQKILPLLLIELQN